MKQDRKFLVEVGMNNLPFPMKVISKVTSSGQDTIANISVSAHVMREFETIWIDKFIRNFHQHRDIIRTRSLMNNIMDYVKDFGDVPIKINYEYPFFIEKLTPVSKEKCLVKFNCSYSAMASSLVKPRIVFKIEIPVITTYPQSTFSTFKRLFAQLSKVIVEVESSKDIYPEDIVEIVEKHALASIYSFLTPEDQDYIIQKVHTESKSSVVVVDEIKEELAHNQDTEWYSVQCSNFGMLHSYSTAIQTEKGMWVPGSDYSAEQDRGI